MQKTSNHCSQEVAEDGRIHDCSNEITSRLAALSSVHLTPNKKTSRFVRSTNQANLRESSDQSKASPYDYADEKIA